MVKELVKNTLARGNSADRQRAVYAEGGRLEDVVSLVVDETQGPPGGPQQAVAPLRRYRVRAGDEAVGPSYRPRPVYADMVEFFRRTGEHELNSVKHARRDWIDKAGMTFGVDGDKRRFSVDLVPRVITPHEWHALRVGLVQRARAIELFLRDVYGDQRIVSDGVLSRELVEGSPGWRAEAARLPSGTVRAPIMGFDLVRNEFGGWRVLEDNVRNPSGAAYAIAIRDLMDACLPELPRPPGLLSPASALPVMRECLLAQARPGGTAALLSSGPGASAWFEHRLLADRAGVLLVLADDLTVEGGEVLHRRTGERIDALYLRLDVELIDLVDANGRSIGAEVFDIAVAGRVTLANAPGNGVADDKAMYCNVPELIGYYLDERPSLEAVPTYRTSDEAEARTVLDRVGELVTKPVDGHGGIGVLIGPDASAAEVAARRMAIAANPAGWVAQEVVALSSHPHAERHFLAAAACGPAGVRLPSRRRAGGLYPGRSGADPGRPGGQPGGQLLPRWWRQRHLDHRNGIARQPLRERRRGRDAVWTTRRTDMLHERSEPSDTPSVPSEEEDSILRAQPRRAENIVCGLVGELRFDGDYADIAAVDRISAVLSPRGPDGCGVWCRGPVAFGHRRLSIIDLSVDGSQPMVDSELGLSLVFNGCIYNYQQLRSELESHGHRFFSTSDTEVIGKAYARVGPELRRSFLRHVRVRDLRATQRQVDLGPGPARDQAALSRPDAAAASLCLHAAGAVGGRGYGHVDRPDRACLLHDFPQRRAGPVHHRLGHPEAAARHATGGGAGRFAHRSPVLGPGFLS